MATYIYQQDDWPNFYYRQEGLADLLSSVERRQGQMVGRAQALGWRLKDEALLESLTEEALKSSEIEGELLGREDVRSSVAQRLGIEIGGLVATRPEVDGVVDMTVDATQNYEEPMTAERLWHWHSRLFPFGRGALRAITVGQWRQDQLGPMQVVSGRIGYERVHFEAPSALALDAEMKRFLLWIEEDQPLNPVIKAGIGHLWFITLHPFDDGNGRIARAVTDLLLARSDRSNERLYSMSSQIMSERKGYYDNLESTQAGSLDVTAWLTWFLSCLNRALVRSEDALRRILVKAQIFGSPESSGLNPRQMKMVSLMIDGFEGKLTTTKWAQITHCSQDTALRDIEDLSRRSILVKEAPGGRSTSYGLRNPSTR